MDPVDLVGELAAALRDVIQATPEGSLDEDAERVYLSLACRLIVRLAPTAAIVPKEHTGKPPEDCVAQVKAASSDLGRVIGLLQRSGYDHAALLIAIIDVYIRTARVKDRHATTSTLLHRLSEEALAMADEEDREPEERRH